MATIGLDGLYYAPITEAANGTETYGTPVKLAGAIQVDVTVENYDAQLDADDGIFETIREFKKGTLSLKVAELIPEAAVAMLGVTKDSNGVIVSTAEDISAAVAVAYRALKSNGKYRYFWLYRVKFSTPSTNLVTKGDNITFQTPTIEGTVMQRHKADGAGKHPWKVEVTEGETGVTAATIEGWTTAVYEPSYPAAQNNH